MSDTEIRRPDDGWPEAETVVHSSAPPPPPPLPDRRIGAGMLLGIVAILLVAGGIALAWYLTHRGSSDTSTVTVTTASRVNPGGPMKVAVPRVVGATEVVAVEQLHQAGLVPKIQFQQSSQPKGTVLSQDPQEAANVTHGAKVTLVVAKSAKPETTSAPAPTTTAPAQPTTATVPDVTQQPEAAAVQAFGQAGILASLTFVPSNDVLGTVEAQAKASGASLPFHSHVQINLSTGPGQKQNEQVPNVIGQPLKQALAAINGAHLRLLYLHFPVTSQSQAGKIVQQSPLGGGNAPQNAQVLVYLGTLQKQ